MDGNDISDILDNMNKEYKSSNAQPNQGDENLDSEEDIVDMNYLLENNNLQQEEGLETYGDLSLVEPNT